MGDRRKLNECLEYYRKCPIKRRGVYFLFTVIGAALISSTGKTSRGVSRELREARTIGMHNYTSNCCMNPVSRAYIKTLVLTNWSRSHIAIWF